MRLLIVMYKIYLMFKEVGFELKAIKGIFGSNWKYSIIFYEKEGNDGKMVVLSEEIMEEEMHSYRK